MVFHSNVKSAIQRTRDLLANVPRIGTSSGGVVELIVARAETGNLIATTDRVELPQLNRTQALSALLIVGQLRTVWGEIAKTDEMDVKRHAARVLEAVYKLEAHAERCSLSE